MVDINYLALIAVAIIMALAYSLPGFFSNMIRAGQKWQMAEFLATIVYSIIVGVLAVFFGLINLDTLANYQAIFSPMWIAYSAIYTVLLYFFSKIFVPVAQMFSAKTTFYAKSVKMGLRKMDQESRGYLVFDLPEQNKQPTLNCVDQAEAKDPMEFQYAIQSGAWIFLIENGELTGAKHYFFRGWFGAVVTWKPITAKCLEQIRATGKFPEYEALY